MELAEAVYRATGAFPKAEVFGLVSQMRRSAVSVPSNIAEGQARNSRGEMMQSLGHARGSLAKLETQTILAIRRDYISADDARTLSNSIAEVGRVLNGLRNSLKNKASNSDH